MQAKSTQDLEGLDISSYQTIADEALLYSTVSYMYFRAYGSAHTTGGDTKFNDFVASAIRNNIPSGAYYFGTPKAFATDAEAIADAQGQAQQFIDKLHGAYGVGNVGELTPMLDVETYTDVPTQTPNYPMASGMTGAQLITWIKAFRDYFYNITKRRLGFYSNRYFLIDPTQMALTTAQLNEIKDMPLWLAEYDQYYGGAEGNVQPADLGGWTTYAIWQYAVIADSPTHGITSAGDAVDHNRTKDLSWLLVPPKVENFTVTDNNNGSITVTMEHPTVLDYIGASVYVNNIWKAWLTTTNTTTTINNLTIGQTYNVQIVTEDNYHDFTYSDPIVLTLADAPPIEEPPPTEEPTEEQTGGNEMARKTNALTSETVERFVVDAGAVYFNLGEPDERLFGATRGGNSFVIEQDIKRIEIDGVRGATKGARRVIESNARITANLLELTSQNIMTAIAGTDATDFIDGEGAIATHDEIRRTRNISDLDYIKSVSIVGQVSGSAENIICTIFNALADEGFELAFEDREEGSLEVSFTAHFDPNDVTMEPWAIRFPKDVSEPIA
jgi:GH25 family lysozyme M1 (1,4-beta-N-acetylmuramidase)